MKTTNHRDTQTTEDDMADQAPTLESYTWHSYYDDAQEKRVSNWDLAEPCQECGRQIVHVYTVNRADGSVVNVGKECAHIALGWKLKNGSKLDRMRAEAIQRKRQEKQEREWKLQRATELAKGTAAEASRACRARNSNYNGDVTILQGDAGFYTVPACCAGDIQTLETGGWTVYNSQTEGAA